MDGDFLEAVKRHALSRLQLWGLPSIMHAVPGPLGHCPAHVRGDSHVEIPHLDGQASLGTEGWEYVSWIVSFAGTGCLASSRVCLCFFVSG